MRRVAAAWLLVVLGGCAPVGPDYHRPDFDVPNAFAEREASPATLTGVPVDWWRLYRDPTLDRLVATGLAQGADVRLAIARLDEAAALVHEANATLLPEVDVTGMLSRSGFSRQTPAVRAGAPSTVTNFSPSLNTAFELDFWGRLRRLREAAQAQFMATEYARGVVGLTLSATIARTYFNLRALDAQIVVSQESVKAAEDSVAITRRRSEGGIASALDLYQAEGNRAQLAAQLKDLQRMRAVSLHQLGVLTSDLRLDVAPGDLRTVPSPPLPPAGLPSALLDRRPDLRQAEASLAAANAQIGVARAAQLPTISLTASLGVQSETLARVVSPGANIWSIGVGLLGPVIDWGRFAARTEAAEARARQAEIVYEQALRGAFREVSDALSNVGLAAQTEQDLAARVDYASNSLRLATQRYEAGYSAYLEVLDAQRTLNDAQLALVRNRQSLLTFTVDLMNALGGGWTAA